MAAGERPLQEKKLLEAMEEPAGREVIVELIKYNLSRGELGSLEVETIEGSPKAFEAFLDFHCMVCEHFELAKLADSRKNQ